jgi:type II secretory pathway pseudopilin PulG
MVNFADVPPQDEETDEQRQERENANAARAVRRQQDIATTALGAGHEQANNRSTGYKSTPTPGNKHLQH